jgi:hypothetical protein
VRVRKRGGDCRFDRVYIVKNRVVPKANDPISLLCEEGIATRIMIAPCMLRAIRLHD